MELKKAIPKEIFIHHILALQDNTDNHPVNKEFLEGFLELLIPSEKIIAAAPDSRFPISVYAASSLFSCEPADFLRLVIGRRERADRNPKKTRFKQGVDYIIQPASNLDKRNTLYMTSSCFARACMLFRRERGDLARQYFHLVDVAYRDYMGESIAKRLQIEDPKITAEKMKNPIRDGSREGTPGIPSREIYGFYTQFLPGKQHWKTLREFLCGREKTRCQTL